MTQSTPFRYVRDAELVPRPSTPFRYVRDAELVPRPSTPFRYLRGAPPAFDPNIIRGLQFRPRIIGDDRFVNRLTSVLSTTSAIDLTATGTTPLFTVPAGNLALIQGVILRVTSGTASTDATISLGINPSTTDLFDEQELVQFRIVNDVFSLWSDKSTILVAQEGDQIDLDVTVAAAGTLNPDAYLIGFLI
jgi:hypothetical protein